MTITKIRGLPKVTADRTGMWAILLCLIVRLCFFIKKEKWIITWEHTRKFRDRFSRKIAKRFKRKNETYAFHRTFNDGVSMFATVIRAFAFQQFIPGSILRLVVGRRLFTPYRAARGFCLFNLIFTLVQKAESCFDESLVI